LISSLLPGAPPDKIEAKVIAMCFPTVGQIKNIEQLYEKDIITLDRIKLLCIYHEDESTDYRPSYDYARENGLTWIDFKKITGRVEPANIFKKNNWTPQFREIFEATNGIIFTGGADIPPLIYGEENHLLTDAPTPMRSFYEISLLFHLVGGSRNADFVPFLEEKKEYPVLAFCLGMQSLNVAAGGTLWQDIPAQVYHLETMEQTLRLDEDQVHSALYVKALNPSEKDLPPAFHRIKFNKKSIFVQRMNMKSSAAPFILTSHHQAVKELGKDLLITATSMDGKIIEAIEHKKYKNVLGVQFHPESYLLYQKGKYYKKKPGEQADFNLRIFLKNNPPALQFHLDLWRWFSNNL
ncbi:MAG: gamma-glutamyl-gamma-aminobutyrate hydrolase family protein, partial [Candidatus Aminicenantes bacterium]|nr:gamma-glutamyl-gamma-aminobutyrate hydrolase family protein [Candidatus Aminicenantes bacterium]